MSVRLTLSSESLEYEEDVGTARCRLPSSLQRTLGAVMQSILEIRVWSQGQTQGGEQYTDVLCVAYPDSQEVLGEDEICVDMSVSIATQPYMQSLALQCMVLCVHPPVNCSAVYVSPEDVAPRSLIGLPVSEDSIITANESCGRKCEVKMLGVNFPAHQRSGKEVRKVGLVSLSTVVIGKTRSITKCEDSHGNDSCRTMAVNEIIRKVVTPLASLPRSALTSGVLLLGPAGVGKTSAIRAVQKLCGEWCSIHIIEVSIPDILADDDPEGKLSKLLAETEAPMLSHTDATEQQLVSPATSPPPPPSQITYRSPDKSTSAEKSLSSFSFLTPSPSSSPSAAAKSTGTGPWIKTTDVASILQLRVLFLDEVDALGTSEGQSEVQRVITQALCSWFDRDNEDPSAGPPACVIATSNRSEGVAPSLRRGGRLELEINITSSREDRLSMTRHLMNRQLVALGLVSAEVDVDNLAGHVADRTGGYVAADIVALVSKAIELKEEEGFSSMSWHRCFDVAMNMVPPSCLRGVALSTPSIGYDDVVGNEEVKQALKRVLRFFSPDMSPKMAAFGLKMPGGVLLHGPPGNSKTRLVMAAASHHHLPVISLSAADVFSPYVGDSEAEIRKAFSVARQAAPCVLFLDELDAFVTNRDGGAGGGSGSSSVEARVLATLLTEMDGIGYSEDATSSNFVGGNSSSASGVAVMAATNRLGAIDAALLRKGRFHHVLHVPAPDERTRVLLLDYFADKCHLTPEEVKRTRAKLREGQCGADVENLCREARLDRIRAQVQNVV